MLVCDYENCSDFTDDPEVTSGGVHAEYSTVYHDECYKQKLFAEYVEDFVAQEIQKWSIEFPNAEIDVEACPTPKVSYTLSVLLGNPLNPFLILFVENCSFLPVKILCP